jgi:CDP-diglyceride synthetase
MCHAGAIDAVLTKIIVDLLQAAYTGYRVHGRYHPASSCTTWDITLSVVTVVLAVSVFENQSCSENFGSRRDGLLLYDYLLLDLLSMLKQTNAKSILEKGLPIFSLNCLVVVITIIYLGK